jgi:flagellar capping protein FliD
MSVISASLYGGQLRMEDAALHKRIDDLRDETIRSIDTLRAEMSNRFADMNNRFADMNNRFADMNNRFADMTNTMNQRFTTLTWIITGWFSLLTLLIVIFKFFA